MERIVLPKRLARQLREFAGASVAEKIDYLTERTATANLRDCNERISQFESCYGSVFADFESAWEHGTIANRHSYRTETDFLEWEALEQEKEHWLSFISSVARDASNYRIVDKGRK